jgi:hypothetical protein
VEWNLLKFGKNFYEMLKRPRKVGGGLELMKGFRKWKRGWGGEGKGKSNMATLASSDNGQFLRPVCWRENRSFRPQPAHKATGRLINVHLQQSQQLKQKHPARPVSPTHQPSDHSLFIIRLWTLLCPADLV